MCSAYKLTLEGKSVANRKHRAKRQWEPLVLIRAANLEAAIRRSGRSRRSVAKEAGVQPATLDHLAQGRQQKVRRDVRGKLAAVLGVPEPFLAGAPMMVADRPDADPESAELELAHLGFYLAVRPHWPESASVRGDMQDDLGSITSPVSWARALGLKLQLRKAAAAQAAFLGAFRLLIESSSGRIAPAALRKVAAPLWAVHPLSIKTKGRKKYST